MTRKLWVAVPAYTGSITCETAECLNAEVYEALQRGWHYVVQFYQMDPMISYARNFLVMRFLASDFTDLIFVDSDVGFPMGTLCRLADYPVDIVGCSYPYRVEPTNYPVSWLDKPELHADPSTGLLEVAALPGGCMRIGRHVLEKMIEAHPEFAYLDRTGEKAYSLFDFVQGPKGYQGEDYTFCHRARALGFKVWLDPLVETTHTGKKVYRGNIGKWLKSRVEQPADAMGNILRFAEMVEKGGFGSKDEQVAAQNLLIEAGKVR